MRIDLLITTLIENYLKLLAARREGLRSVSDTKIPISIRTSSSLPAFKKGLKNIQISAFITCFIFTIPFVHSIFLFPLNIVYFSCDAVCLTMCCDLFLERPKMGLYKNQLYVCMQVCMYVCMRVQTPPTEDIFQYAKLQTRTHMEPWAVLGLWIGANDEKLLKNAFKL